MPDASPTSTFRPWLEELNRRSDAEAALPAKPAHPARVLWRELVKGFPNGWRRAMFESFAAYWARLKQVEARESWRAATDATAARMLAPTASDRVALDTFDAPDPRIDILIPTLNEASHIAQTIANARQLGAVFVLDSLSTDGTQELARAAGAVVVEHAFEGYAKQKNWGLEHLPLRGEWVFILDADERLTADLIAEIRGVIGRSGEDAKREGGGSENAKSQGGGSEDASVAAAPANVNGYYVNRLFIHMGRPLRHGGMFPSWNLRLFRRGKARYEDRAVHEHMLCDGATAHLAHPMLHLRRETLSQFIAKHIHYADLESEVWSQRRKGMQRDADAGELFSAGLRLRQWIRRAVWPRLPGRPLWRFLYMYVLKRGFLDGVAGWRLAILMAQYEAMIGAMDREKRGG